MRNLDNRYPFLIESCDVRGQLVHMDESWTTAMACSDYPETVSTVLGEAFVAATLMAGIIKFDGKITLQLRGKGNVHLLVVQVTNTGKMRGLARWTNTPENTSLSEVFGTDATMSIIIEANQFTEPYQGIVPLEGEQLSDALTHYFAVSEQLQTQMFLHVSQSTAAGMLLQALPAEEQHGNDADGFNRATVLGRSSSKEEMQQLPADELLHRLFHEEQVRLFDEQPIQFACSCSKERTDGLLTGLGEEEVNSILEEQGQVSISCEFCNAEYSYDSVDVAALFKGLASHEQANSSDLRH